MSSAPQAGIRTYSPSVRVGNWNEDVCLEEDTLKDFLSRKERGDLLVQKTHSLGDTILKPVELSLSQDGYLRYGDVVMLRHLESSTVLSANMKPLEAFQSPCLVGPCAVACSTRVEPCARNAFVVTSCDERVTEKSVVYYGEPFYLKTLPGAGGDLYLESDRATFQKSAKKSRKQEVLLVAEKSQRCTWSILCHDPQMRLETEGYPIQMASTLLINHCMTNQCLACLTEFSSRNLFGREYEIVSHTFLDSHKAETTPNHWTIVIASPPPPTDGGEEKESGGHGEAAEPVGTVSGVNDA